jgi:similar to stage IV sporulation protein
MNLRGKIRFEINGLNIEKLIGKLYASGIPLYRVARRTHKNLQFTVAANQSPKVIACLENLCYNYKKAQEKGVFPFFKTLLKRFGLLIGIAVFAVALMASSFFLYETRVYGCKNISAESIILCAEKAGAGKMSFGRVSGREIERAVYSAFPQVSFVSAVYKGIVLHINIVEAELFPQIIETSPRDLVASAKGKISRLLVFRGTALVKAGDTVEKGQVIIGGYMESPDGTRIPVRAMGEAYGICELDFTEIFESVKTVKSRTGNSTVMRHIECFGMNFPAKEQTSPYQSYETETESRYLYKNNFLPARLVTTVYYETVTVTVKEDFEKVRKLIIEQAEKKARTAAEKEGKITSLLTSVKDQGNIKYINTKVFIEKTFF